ncbi:MgtC/SapB family protein [Pirellulaceae bacterium SH449]
MKRSLQAISLRISIQLILAAALGGLPRYDRASAGKPVGLRTYLLVSLVAALFVLLLHNIEDEPAASQRSPFSPTIHLSNITRSDGI